MSVSHGDACKVAVVENLREYCRAVVGPRSGIVGEGGETRLEREAGVLRGVKVLGGRSKNGRRYLPECLAAAVRLYEGARVYVNHGEEVSESGRDYRDRLGTMQGVRLEGERGLFADLHFNPRHEVAEQLMWDAEHAPRSLGFSHHVDARVRRSGDEVLVEEIVRVHSVDLVCEPATTVGLFEASALDGAEEAGKKVEEAGAVRGVDVRMSGAASIDWSGVTAEMLEATRPDLVEALVGRRVLSLVEVMKRNQAKQGEAGRLNDEEKARRSLARVGWSFGEGGGGAVDRLLWEALLACGTEEDQGRLIEERRSWLQCRGDGESEVRSGCLAREQTWFGDVAGPRDLEQFVRSVTR